MSAHYCSDEDPDITFIEVNGPNEGHFWDDEVEAKGRHVLLVGDPWGHACHAVVGTRAELRTYARRITEVVNGCGASSGPPAIRVEHLEDMVFRYFTESGKPEMAAGTAQDLVARIARHLAQRGTDIGYADESRVTV